MKSNIWVGIVQGKTLFAAIREDIRNERIGQQSNSAAKACYVCKHLSPERRRHAQSARNYSFVLKHIRLKPPISLVAL